MKSTLKHNLKKLLLSLSGSERKHFKNKYNAQGANKDYMNLFDLMFESGKSANPDDIELLFKLKYPEKSFDNTASYLYKVLTDMLVQMRIDHDDWFYSQHCLMKAKLCFEREIPERGLAELDKIKILAKDRADHLMYYAATRMELSHISENGFPDTTEQELVSMQMRMKQNLQNLRQTHEHYSLFELLNYRMLTQSNHSGDQQDKKLNDLLLSELGIITRGNKQSFESKKLHLLFQAFFLSRTGDYNSALKIFKSLNLLFEQHTQLWSCPPYDYLAALDGILDSLRSIRLYAEMAFFIDKIQVLSNSSYSDHFTQTCRQTFLIYTLNSALGNSDYDQALAVIKTNKSYLPKVKQMVHGHKQLELIFFIAVSYFRNKDLQSASKYISIGLSQDKQGSTQIIYRVSRLFRMLIHFEMGNIDYLEYEMRTFKRLFTKTEKFFQLERLLFHIFSNTHKPYSSIKNRSIWKKYQELRSKFAENPPEQELLKYFDFLSWSDAITKSQKK
ncbi:hypothetical protein [Pedobacter duraquae]|uniref:Uncharacterized protein n=1 Tax=Pedobacter duraquae TaxID=425511 RepID=A0A4R6IKC6_9SPHI|nr:hypothetical protein [Pedobacter duraquae]TDO22524.1 hypothetical protein CLV32_1499 [Pedobacter duraquae]